jgi:anti-sigma-K factor RskA
MDERNEELAALNALSMLENDEKRALDGAIARDKDMRTLSADLEATAAELGRLIASVEPPADLKKRIRQQLRSRSSGKKFAPSADAILSGIGWTLAVILAVTAFWLWRDRSQLQQQLAAVSRAIAPTVQVVDDGKSRTLEEELKQRRDEFEAKQTALAKEIDTLRQQDKEAQARITQLTAETAALKQQSDRVQMQISTLTSTVWEYRRNVLTIVWDSVRHEGVVMLEKMPKMESTKDYQLWIVDGQKPDPVSAGVLTLDKNGSLKTQFKPVLEISEATKFMLTVEAKGGAEKPTGEIVFSGL